MGLTQEGGSWALDEAVLKVTVPETTLMHAVADARADVWVSSTDNGVKVEISDVYLRIVSHEYEYTNSTGKATRCFNDALEWDGYGYEAGGGTVIEEYFCSNYENAEVTYDYDNADDCSDACGATSGCTGGFYYSYNSACYLFGFGDAADEECGDHWECGSSCTAFDYSGTIWAGPPPYLVWGPWPRATAPSHPRLDPFGFPRISLETDVSTPAKCWDYCTGQDSAQYHDLYSYDVQSADWWKWSPEYDVQGFNTYTDGDGYQYACSCFTQCECLVDGEASQDAWSDDYSAAGLEVCGGGDVSGMASTDPLTPTTP